MNVFRGAVLSIVLAVAVGPNVSLLCRVWCDPQAAVASGCHDEGSGSPTAVVKEDGCWRAAFSVAPFLGQEARRGAVAGAMDVAATVPSSIAPHMLATGVSHAVGFARPFETRPLPIALRI